MYLRLDGKQKLSLMDGWNFSVAWSEEIELPYWYWRLLFLLLLLFLFVQPPILKFYVLLGSWLFSLCSLYKVQFSFRVRKRRRRERESVAKEARYSKLLGPLLVVAKVSHFAICSFQNESHFFQCTFFSLASFFQASKQFESRHV